MDTLCPQHQNLSADYGSCAPLHAPHIEQVGESYQEKQAREDIRKLRTRLTWARNEARWAEKYGRRICGDSVASVQSRINEAKERLASVSQSS